MTTLYKALGSIVFYRLTAENARQIINRRGLVHYAGGNSVSEGDVCPMIVTKDDGASINGTVFLDGTDTFWAVDVKEGDSLGTFAATPTDAKPSTEGYPVSLHKGLGEDYKSLIVNDADAEAKAVANGFSRDVPLTDEQKQAVAAALKASDAPVGDPPIAPPVVDDKKPQK